MTDHDPAPPPQPVRFRGTGFVLRRHPLFGWASLVVLGLLWQLAATFQDDFILLPRPADVLEAFVSMARSGELALHVTASLRRIVAGWSLGAAFGFGLGMAIALNSHVRAAALPLVNFLFALPKIALLPLFIVWLGIGEAAKIATIAVGVLSPIVVATYKGIDGVDRRLVRMAQSFDVPAFAIVTRILLPAALPALLTGVRLSLSIAIVLLVGAEMIAARYGLGSLALNSGSLMRSDRLFVALALLGLAGIAMSLTIDLVEHRLLRRHQ